MTDVAGGRPWRRWWSVGGGAFVLAAGLVFWIFTDGDTGVADPDDDTQVAAGQRVYATNCASCHGANLEGQPEWRSPLPTGGLAAPPHDETGHTWHHPDAMLFSYTKVGAHRTLGMAYFKSNMPAFEDTLSGADIWAVLAFIKSRWPPEVRARQERISD